MQLLFVEESALWQLQKVIQESPELVVQVAYYNVHGDDNAGNVYAYICMCTFLYYENGFPSLDTIFDKTVAPFLVVISDKICVTVKRGNHFSGSAKNPHEDLVATLTSEGDCILTTENDKCKDLDVTFNTLY